MVAEALEVDKAVGLRVGARVVELDALLTHRNVDADGELGTRVTAVVVDITFTRVLPWRDLGNLRLHHLAGGLEQSLFVQFETGPTVLLEQFK